MVFLPGLVDRHTARPDDYSYVTHHGRSRAEHCPPKGAAACGSAISHERFFLKAHACERTTGYSDAPTRAVSAGCELCVTSWCYESGVGRRRQSPHALALWGVSVPERVMQPRPWQIVGQSGNVPIVCGLVGLTTRSLDASLVRCIVFLPTWLVATPEARRLMDCVTPLANREPGHCHWQHALACGDAIRRKHPRVRSRKLGT